MRSLSSAGYSALSRTCQQSPSSLQTISADAVPVVKASAAAAAIAIFEIVFTVCLHSISTYEQSFDAEVQKGAVELRFQICINRLFLKLRSPGFISQGFLRRGLRKHDNVDHFVGVAVYNCDAIII